MFSVLFFFQLQWLFLRMAREGLGFIEFRNDFGFIQCSGFRGQGELFWGLWLAM